MYCTKCGVEILDDAKFCGFCGEPTDGLTSRQTQPTQPTQPTPYQGPSVTTTKSSRNIGRIIVALCIVFIFGIFFILGAQSIFGTQPIPSTLISILVVGAIIICCIAGNTGSRRRGGSGCGSGGCDCSGCDCGDCDCGGCDC